jgi:hypothetical protein
MVNKIILLLICSLFFSASCFASDNSDRQIAKIKLFFKVISKDRPTAKQFFRLFGNSNEAEMELIIRQDYPKLDIKENWFDDQKAKKAVDDVYKYPERYSSRFLRCLKAIGAASFTDKTKKVIELPPSRNSNFIRYTVGSGQNKLVFEFSQSEQAIENIYLPNGKSIYSFIPSCKK